MLKKALFGFLFFLFILTSSLILSASESFYQWENVYIGALHHKAWAGLVIAPEKDSLYAFRVRLKKGTKVADGMDILYLVSEVGPHAPDGKYARISLDLSLPFDKEDRTPVLIKPPSKSDTMIFEWSRQDEKTVIGHIQLPDDIECQIIHYFPWNFSGKYRLLDNGNVRGESKKSRKNMYLMWMNQKGKKIKEANNEELIIEFSKDMERDIYFAASVGNNLKIMDDHIYRYKNRRTIASILLEEQRRYRKKRVKIEGLYSEAAKAITNNIFWMSLYQPGKHRFYTPAGRRWIFPKPDGGTDYWTIFEWDSFFNALEVSIESYKHAKDIINSVLETQYPNGNIPNWRGHFGGTRDRSQPPVGAFIVLKLFLKLGDKNLLSKSYPVLCKWHAFWKEKKPNGQIRRDGNGDGLLEWGSDTELVPENVPPWEKDASGLQRAKWESGQDDLPNWDLASFNKETGTMNMNCLDLNCLYALDAWSLAQIAGILNKEDESRKYIYEYEEMKSLINDHLWDETRGFYFDRYWDGRFSTKKAASNFYPLVARIPDKKRAFRVLKHLLNNREFWGEYVIPTISRDDEAFKDQQYWRGAVWPPTNYLVYQGLKNYNFDAVASEFARKSSDLFLQTWEYFQLCPENFDSRTGKPGGKRYQSWGPLFALIALEEYLDFTPWEGFRFGMIKPEDKGKLSRIPIQGRYYEVEVSRSKIELREEGREIVKVNGGAVFRHFLYSVNEISFEINSFEKRKIKINFLTKGKYQLWIDNEPIKIFKGNSIKIKIPAGEHSVMILLLEKYK
ncbi:MAG: amylo-alpha-1,6-glucosidase [Candidatus Aminicenantaceae bacterium]